MHLAVLGGTGRTGLPLVTDALARGHHLRVLARSEAKARQLLPSDHDHLDLVVGDATDPAALEQVAAGTEAMLDVTGPVKNGPKDLRGQVVDALLPALVHQDVSRLVFLTGAGVRVAGDQPTAADRAIRGVMRLLQPAILADGQAAVAAIAASDLDWTVVRAPRLTDGERRGTIRTAPHVGGDTGTTLGRADLAAFLLDEVTAPEWQRQAPVVSW